MDFKDYFKNKKVTVMGLGLLGRGVGDALYLAECGAQVIVTDLKTAEELAQSVALLSTFSNTSFTLGEHKLEDFENRDFILVAAGVPLDSLYLAHAKEHNVQLEMSASLFARVSQIPIIGVTGTRGKSTVTAMIHHVLSETTGEEILLGGNVRGVSNLQLLNNVQEDSLCVMELDSWQLQGFGWAEISPQIAVFTNFMEDHLNYYERGGKTKEEAMDLYFNDKAQIFLHQEESDVFITTPDVFELAKNLPRQGLGEDGLGQEVILADASSIPEDCLLATPGEHNRLNAALAYEALKAVGLSEEEIFEGLATFSGVEGRLQFVGTFGKGVKVYNDNNATTPQATIVGLQALGILETKNIVLIAGGANKGIDTAELVAEIGRTCKEVILIPGNGSEILAKQITVTVVATLREAVTLALEKAEQGDIILFSPAFASFSQYKNEYERNDEFMKLLKIYE